MNTPTCNHRSELGLGCARQQGHDGGHWLTTRADEARAALLEIGIGSDELEADEAPIVNPGLADHEPWAGGFARNH